MELWMHLGGLLSTQEVRVALGYQAGTKVRPDKLGPPVRVGSTRIDSDQLGSNKKIKIGLGSTRIIKKKQLGL